MTPPKSYELDFFARKSLPRKTASHEQGSPKGPARHLDVSRQKNCLPAVLRQFWLAITLAQNVSQNASQTVSRGSPTREGIFPLSKLPSPVRGNCERIETKIASRQVLSRDIKMSLLAHWEWKPWKLQCEQFLARTGFSLVRMSNDIAYLSERVERSGEGVKRGSKHLLGQNFPSKGKLAEFSLRGKLFPLRDSFPLQIAFP